MFAGFNHSSFTVSNLERSIEFYSHVVGMKEISNASRPREYAERVTGIRGVQGMKIAYMSGHGLVLELIEYIGSVKNGGRVRSDMVGAGHICFNVIELAAMMDEMKRRGVECKGAPVTIPAGANKGGLVLYIADPDGIIVELIELPA